MIRTLHFIAATAAAILFECILGNFHIVFPLTICVLWFMGRKFPLSGLIAYGFTVGLFFDLLYFHPQPRELWLFGAALTSAWLIEKKMSFLSPVPQLIVQGFVLGIILFCGNCLLAPDRGGASLLFRFSSLFTILCCPLFLLLLQLLAGQNGKKSVSHEEKKKAPKKTKPKAAAAGKKGKP